MAHEPVGQVGIAGATVNWQWFAGASLLVVGLLLKVGAPLETVAAGVALAAYWNWKGSRLTRLLSR